MSLGFRLKACWDRFLMWEGLLFMMGTEPMRPFLRRDQRMPGVEETLKPGMIIYWGDWRARERRQFARVVRMDARSGAVTIDRLRLRDALLVYWLFFWRPAQLRWENFWNPINLAEAGRVSLFLRNMREQRRRRREARR